MPHSSPVARVPDGSSALLRDRRARQVYRWPARTGTVVEWPAWVPQPVREAWARVGVSAPWQHQVEVANAAVSGQDVVVSTRTASGKSLAYLLPVLAATYGGRDARGPERSAVGAGPTALIGPVDAGPPTHTALYLAPTKALAADQLRACHALGLPGWQVATLDGDTEPDARDWVRQFAGYVLTNPDMLHRSVLPHHARWARLLRSLRYVVIDEAHRYRGVFGAQVAAVLGRLRRLAHHYGSDPVFVLAAATTAAPKSMASRLLNLDESRLVVVDRDQAALAARCLVLWEPAGDADDEAAELLAQLASGGRQTLAFTQSRRAAEVIALRARGLVSDPDVRIDAYRAGYLPADRRRIERGLQEGTLRGVASTTALELGVDIAGLDAVVIAGFPGTRAAFWQQAGRAGRRGAEALVILLARRHPLDRFLLDHPEALVEQPVEATVLDAGNPYVLAPQLTAAAQELPLTERDARYFGPRMPGLISRLERAGALRRRPTGWYWTGAERAVDAVDLRSVAGAVDIVEASTGRVLGLADPRMADSTLHEGAVYLHQGETYVSDGGGAEDAEILVHAANPGYLTQARRRTSLSILAERSARPFGQGRLGSGEVEVRSRVTGYLRRDAVTGRVWDQTPLDLPERVLRTIGVWWCVDTSLLPDEVSLSGLAAGAHAAEHAGLNLLPAFAPCDSWDLGGSFSLAHPDTRQLTVFAFDAVAGGAGFAEYGYDMADSWLAAVADRLASCDCGAGCPACVVSPGCGSADTALDKWLALTLLGLLTGSPNRPALTRSG